MSKPEPEPPKPLTTFTAVPRKRPRHDGWTPERQRAFIDALAACGSVVQAARHVGMGYTTAYRLRNQPGAEEFAAAWDAAIAKATSRIHDVLVDHAINGAPVPIVYHGEVTDEYRVHNHRLMMWLLSHHKPEQFALHGPAGASHTPTAKQLAEQKAQWRAEWEAEQAEKTEQETARGEEMRTRLHDKLDAMRARLIARHKAGVPFNPHGASKVEIMLQSDIEGETPDLNTNTSQKS